MSDVDKRLKIYLAGRMSGLTFEQMNTWRAFIKKDLMQLADMNGYRISVINPVDFYNFEEHKHQSEKEIMRYDLSHVRTSDLVVVNILGLNVSDGTKLELYEALRNDIPVISFGDSNTYDKLHSWIKECITRHETLPKELTSYIRDFYLI